MLISRDKFIYYLTKYRQAYEEQNRFHDALRPFFDSPVCKYKDDLMQAYEELLVEVSECSDEDGIFSWWLYEGSEDSTRIITVKESGKEPIDFDVATAEGLYDYLVAVYDRSR